MSEALTPELERVELALKALYQIEALLPMAQRQADEGVEGPDTMLGLLGRIRQMNDAAMSLLAPDADKDGELVERWRIAVLGRRETSHV